MAQRYRKIDPRTWNDEKFSALTPGEKLIALYVLTAQSNRCGLFVYSHALAMDHTKVAPDSYAKAFPGATKALGWVYEERSRVIYVPTWWKYNPPENEKHLKGCLSDLHDLPKTGLLKEFRQNTKYLPDRLSKDFGRLVDSYGIAMGIATRYQEQELEQNQELEKEPPTEACGEAAARPSPPPSAKKSIPTEAEGGPEDFTYPRFPCVAGRRSQDRTWLLSDSQIAEWQQAFPGVDIPAECRRAFAWVKANPARRKTTGGMADFLFRWLSRTQDQSNRSPNSGKSYGAAKPDAGQRGEFAEEPRPLPTTRRAVPAAGA